ncbi:hypothetical protein SNEBB_004022 [Seison nebaliae]|nr:hypothetical protein SNEBB_004022 [Seison nebaliae]
MNNDDWSIPNKINYLDLDSPEVELGECIRCKCEVYLSSSSENNVQFGDEKTIWICEYCGGENDLTSYPIDQLKYIIGNKYKSTYKIDNFKNREMKIFKSNHEQISQSGIEKTKIIVIFVHSYKLLGEESQTQMLETVLRMINIQRRKFPNNLVHLMVNDRNSQFLTTNHLNEMKINTISMSDYLEFFHNLSTEPPIKETYNNITSYLKNSILMRTPTDYYIRYDKSNHAIYGLIGLASRIRNSTISVLTDKFFDLGTEKDVANIIDELNECHVTMNFWTFKENVDNLKQWSTVISRTNGTFNYFDAIEEGEIIAREVKIKIVAPNNYLVKSNGTTKATCLTLYKKYVTENDNDSYQISFENNETICTVPTQIQIEYQLDDVECYVQIINLTVSRSPDKNIGMFDLGLLHCDCHKRNFFQKFLF